MSEWTEADLDALFVGARAGTAEDAGAAARFLTRRARVARRRAAGGVSAALAAAAVVAGVLAWRPAPTLPASAAYAAYSAAQGDEW
ncbi:hypothetical protein [Deinococcus maricopensis]|uniref:Uncharacterized protein n=1 Tax=Deinococcus maricopensis (strain DSM 21211 / LMG 22137 / NRRL B-23946 / LB-34) TaxID=709986 RepID=E8U5N0_DEIML|nr:hypothetical protein [Deinococcus maricopensis]ADV66369.1 hypothetical protein Deima_0713 [Deinococcus maricopensis DSM 21211]